MTALNEQNILERVANENRSEAQQTLSKTERAVLIKQTGSTEATTPVALGQYGSEVTKVTFTPVATKAATTRGYNLINKGSANAGTTVVASGVAEIAAFTQGVIPLTGSGTVNTGDVLVLKTVGTTESPEGEVAVTIAKKVKTGSGSVANESVGYIGSVPQGA